ncbi:hypothetical protein [Diaphorobacter nitroreducens]|uniref:hypothetical protein n=1 Tax=Diaphorobacter nitroreducens TaxID=164759 RepID=UPI00289C9425|nr:hypothetical protein [Diaphorobacter nitroreducens]
MALTSIIQVLKINELRKGNKNGRDWAMQDAECMLLNDAGELEQVGVLPLPKDMMGDAAPKPGIYVGSFALRAGMQDRKIGAVLTALTPYPAKPAAKAAQ